MIIQKPTIYVGIQISAGKMPVTYAAVTAERRLFAMGQGPLEEALSFAAGQSDALVAVNAPPQPNQGLMRANAVRRSFSPLPPPRLQDLRLAEYLLRIQGLKIPSTSSDPARCPAWMQVGFRLYEQLRGLEYCPHPSEGKPRRFLESQADAAFWSLLGVHPLEHGTLEGRLQRQMVLYLNDMPLADPLEFFEEITRFRLLQGVLPLKEIGAPAELDAMVAALTAWLADNRPARVKCFGDVREGEIVLPLPDPRK
jgi:hypothetical protein